VPKTVGRQPFGGRERLTIEQRPESVNFTGPDITSDRIDALRSLIPDAFTEGRIDFAKLRAALEDDIDDRPDRYSFSWAGKRDAIRLLQTPSQGTLLPVPEQSIDFDSTENIFIEGDNLEVLKLLYKPYFGRIKMIYIDPPYNTGNDFIYPDNYAHPIDAYLQLTGQGDDAGNLLTSNPETAGRYHSAWLSMMYPRLYLARQLLTQDGVIFLSIDDHEVHNLKLLLNEIFGEENFVGQIAVQLNPRGRHLDKFLAKTHEYVLAYARDASEQATYALEKDDRMAREYNKSDVRGDYREIELRNRNPAFNSRTRPNLFYPIFVDPKSGTTSLTPTDTFAAEVWPKNSEGNDSCWTWGKSKLQQLSHQVIGRQTSSGAWRIFRKDYLLNEAGESATTLPKSLWIDKEINNDYGKKAVQELFNGRTVFDFPKSPALIKKLLQIGSGKDDIVLDFFGGSCTTAQSVVELNRQDTGQRRFIMVQLPELVDPPIDDGTGMHLDSISMVGRERVKRVLIRLRQEDEGKLPHSSDHEPEDLGFKVYRLGASSFPPWEGMDPTISPEDYTSQLAMFTDPLRDGWRPLDVVCEVATKEGLSLTSDITARKVGGLTIWWVSDASAEQAILVCLDDSITFEDVKELGLSKEDRFICRDIALDDSTAANLALQCHLKTI
jgi:adenine-specific DNA-methyltransferase